MIDLANLDCDVTSNCQLSCVGCNRMVTPHRFSAAGIPYARAEQVASDLLHFGRVAHARRFAAIGGEPLLHPDLLEILRVVRASGAVDEVTVWTNGLALARMPEAFWSKTLFDTIVFSAYPGKFEQAEIDWILERAKAAGLGMEFKDERFAEMNWTRILEREPTGDVETQAKYEACWFKSYCHALNNGSLYRCCTSPHIPQLLQGREEGADGLPIEGVTEETMRAFLGRPAFMESCRVCKGRNNRTDEATGWSERKGLAAWLEASKGNE